MIEVEVRLRDAADPDTAGLLVPIPFDTWDQTFLDLELEGAEVSETLAALNSGQRAYWIRAFSPDTFRLVYRFERKPGTPPDWLWALPAAPFAASPDLEEQARAVAAQGREPMRSLVDHTVEHFEYGHPERSFLADQETIPAVCDVTEGSCVDIHTYFISAARALDLPATYLHGYYFRDGETSPGFHCWLATRDGEGIQAWDLSHALIFDRRPAPAGFDDFPGERFAIGAGKDIEFDIAHRRVRCPILCHPTAIGADGVARRARVEVRLLG